MFRTEDGITLIELLVTIAFIGMILISATLILTDALHVGRVSDRRNQALNLAGMVMEDLQNREYSSVQLQAGTYVYPVGDLHQGRFQANYRVIDPDPADPERWADGKPLLKTLQVTVRWLEGGKAREVQLTTYRARTVLKKS